MSANKMLEMEIRAAYIFLREKNHTIPSDTLQFMLDASLEKLNSVKDNEVLDIVSKPVTKENKPRLYEEGYMNSGLSTKDILSMISENQLKLFNEIQKNAC